MKPGFARVKRTVDLKGDGCESAIVVFVPVGYKVKRIIQKQCGSIGTQNLLSPYAMMDTVGIQFEKVSL